MRQLQHVPVLTRPLVRVYSSGCSSFQSLAGTAALAPAALTRPKYGTPGHQQQHGIGTGTSQADNSEAESQC